MYIKNSKNSIEAQIRKERETRKQLRKQEDIHSGLSRAKGPQRGDYESCRQQDKLLQEFKRFKDPRDRAKIEAERQGREQEQKRKWL